MSKQKTIKSLDSVIGRLIHIGSKLEGNQLQEAIREVAYVRDKLQSGQIDIRKLK
jgi:hypothetical protein